MVWLTRGQLIKKHLVFLGLWAVVIVVMIGSIMVGLMIALKLTEWLMMFLGVE